MDADKQSEGKEDGTTEKIAKLTALYKSKRKPHTCHAEISNICKPSATNNYQQSTTFNVDEILGFTPNLQNNGANNSSKTKYRKHPLPAREHAIDGAQVSKLVKISHHKGISSLSLRCLSKYLIALLTRKETGGSIT